MAKYATIGGKEAYLPSTEGRFQRLDTTIAGVETLRGPDSIVYRVRLRETPDDDCSDVMLVGRGGAPAMAVAIVYNLKGERNIPELEGELTRGYWIANKLVAIEPSDIAKGKRRVRVKA